MGLAGWILRHLLPPRPPSHDPAVEAAFVAATQARRRTTESALGATAAVQQNGRAVEAERARIRARTESAARKHRAGQTSAVALAVEDVLRLQSFGGPGNDEG